VEVVAGDVEKEQEQAIKTYDKIYKREISEQADVAIISGHPMENDLKEALVAAVGAEPVVKEGGTYILVSACFKGINQGVYEVLKRRMKVQDIVKNIKRHTLPITANYIATSSRVVNLLETKEIIVVTDGLSKKVISQMRMTHANSIREAIRTASTKHKKPDTLIMPSMYCYPTVS
jgi:nickel-dependent lactate racemase